MQIATTHVNTDFDALASLVAATFIYPGAVGVLPTQIQPKVREFLAIHQDLFRLKLRNEADLSEVTRLIVVDTNHWDRLDRMHKLEKEDGLEVILWDHHMQGGNIKATWQCRQEAGANITLMLSEMRRRGCAFAPMQATLFLMGLYDDTGNLTYPSTTKDDAYAAGYLLDNGADLNVAAAYLSISLDDDQTELLTLMLESSKVLEVSGYRVGVSFLPIERGMNMLASVVTKYKELKGLDAAFGIFCNESDRCVVIGRGGGTGLDVGAVVRKLGGGGHPAAGSAMVKSEHPAQVYRHLIDLIDLAKRPAMLVGGIMSEPQLCLRAGISILEARALLQKKHVHAAVVTDQDVLLGIISDAEVNKAKSDSQLRAPVKAFMKTKFAVLHPAQPVGEALRLMKEEEVGLLPVMAQDRLVGVVTRADLMLHIYDL
ncbi:CBS domain-containing protein [Desulfoferrobacter suflitae]|uniref:CBS domain-containing protein n=1 Tax=Desulfoferrobacter suflitae TaxID=2865782 RepID=UPI002164A4D0|nr:CBS domain-containing protein [Desulfoferrobacter suflitae]MCK8602759.1 CBS domain-containing protein [Desulfoferrobacter suflitae]